VNWVKVKRMLYIGIPSGIQSSLFSFSNVIIQSAINSFGDDTVAGSAASGNIEGFIYIAMNSVYHVALTFIGQNVGARKYKNIRRLTVYSIVIVAFIGLFTGGVGVLARYPLIGLYISSEAAVEAALTRFMIIVPTYFLCGIMDVCCGGLRALDRSVTAMIISLGGACGIRVIWLQTIFKVFATPESIYLSYPVSWIVTAGFHLLFMILAAKKIMKNSKSDALLTPEPHNR
jgi:Na+-driven multidrug efflux pump